MPNDRNAEDTRVLSEVILALNQLEPEARDRVLQTVAIFFGKELVSRPFHDEPRRVQNSVHNEFGQIEFSEDLSISPKDFLIEKLPRSDVERVACLAYYLAHYRNMPHFKTLDLSKLNTEAAQPKFSNAAYATGNALKLGYLAQAPKGQRQLSAVGEQFVRALPDRDAAKTVMARARPKRRAAKKRPSSTKEGTPGA